MTLFKVGDIVEFVKEYDRAPIGTIATIFRCYEHAYEVSFNEPTFSSRDGSVIGWGNSTKHPHGLWSISLDCIELAQLTSNIIEPSEDIYNDLI